MYTAQMYRKNFSSLSVVRQSFDTTWAVASFKRVVPRYVVICVQGFVADVGSQGGRDSLTQKVSCEICYRVFISAFQGKTYSARPAAVAELVLRVF